MTTTRPVWDHCFLAPRDRSLSFDEERRREKQQRRDLDSEKVSQGARTAEQMNRENSLAFGLTSRFKMKPSFG